MRESWGISVSLILATGLGAMPAYAFHDGGVSTCARCHVMHGERDGEIVMEGNDPLLVAACATDVCLTCHGGAAGVFGYDPLMPPPERGAGNFVFLLEDNLNDAPDSADHPIAGEAAGHSIVSLDRGVDADSRWTQAPGGTYPTAALGCTSCHDPHGNGAFRLLRGVGPVPGGTQDFLEPAPQAQGLPIGASAPTESRESHTAYRSGVSAWCGNCHGRYHEFDGGDFAHPGDAPLGETARSYGRYDGTSRATSGVVAFSYLPEVPFEDPAAATDRTAGPAAHSRLNCLSCHRAHASSGPASGRWDFHVQRLNLDGRLSGSYPLPNPYRDTNQGSLCAKCHTNPSDDHDQPQG